MLTSKCSNPTIDPTHSGCYVCNGKGEAERVWRVGTKLGRTLYINDVCVGMVDTPELAAAIVEAMNRS